MAYIGKQPVVGNFQVCDAISVVNGQAAYTMQVASTNVSPESANHMLVSLNGVLQKPGSSFTVSGATITFASNLVTNDVIDFIMLLGDVLNTGTPSDGAVLTAGLAANAVTGAKLNTDVISAQTALTAEPADTDEFLVSDAGVLKRIDYSLIKGSSTHTLLTTNTITSGTATSDFTSNIDSTYKAYMFDIITLHPASDAQVLKVRFSQSSSFVTSSTYDHTFTRMDGGVDHSSVRSVNDDSFQIANIVDGANDSCLSGRLFLYDPAGTTFEKAMTFHTTHVQDGDQVGSTIGAGRLDSTTAVDGVQFFMGSGNIDSAVIKMYGIT